MFGRPSGQPRAISGDELDRLIERASELGVGGGDYWSGGKDMSPLGSDALTAFDYFDPFTGEEIDPGQAIELCGFWRRLITSNQGLSAAIGFAFWKRATVAPLLWAGTGPVPFAADDRGIGPGDTVAVWKSRTRPKVLRRLEASGARLIEVEDGFIRSAGLGADCIPPLSIVVDRSGIYFDPNQQSDLEKLIQDGGFAQSMLKRAKTLRELIVELGISKYSAATPSPANRPLEGNRRLLVPGQVEDDRSILSGDGIVRTNIELLRRVRERNPTAHITYKPHPDVVAGHRIGAIPDQLVRSFADELVADSPISALIDSSDEVHVNTSLAGFEALVRGKRVVTYGVPFYSGWGLTEDLGEVPARRNARRTLDELVAATLLLYPRYLDPVTGLPCPPEVLVRRLSEQGKGGPNGPLVRLRRLQGRLKRVASALRIWR